MPPLFLEHTKRFVLIFQLFDNKKIYSKSITEYDSLEEAREEMNLLDDVYKDTPGPIEVPDGANVSRKHDYVYLHGKYYDFFPERKFWSYVLLDFENEKVLKWGGHKRLFGNIDWQAANKKRYSENLFLKDYFFRKKDEIPADYKWQPDEYPGWLIYRWDRRRYNALFNEKKPPVKKDDSKNDIEEELIELPEMTHGELIQEEYDELMDKEMSQKLFEKYGW